MFISGSPGTGKTALVTRIVRELTAEHPGDLRVISINCMALKSLEVLWERMADELEHDAFKKRSAGKKAKGREVVQALLRASNFKW
jgi:cell division control protein 6